MDNFQVVILALVQGLTEFLPISSSAHLILVPVLTDWPDQGLAFDVAVHAGTLTAVVLYFRKELARMFVEWLASFKGRLTPDARLAWAVLIGTIPVGLAGLIFKDLIETQLRSPMVIAVATIVFGLLLWYADRTGKHSKNEYGLSLIDVLIIGVAQALALIPGTSRSGITITAALMLGLKREAAARFSFLLSIPVIFLAGSFETVEYLSSASISDAQPLLIGALISAISAYACIHYFLKLLERIGMLPFVAYRLVLGVILVVLFI
ncbi:MAG: undecaprenyl-diphosphate phosphatase [Gammaproteobacteria bacterium]|nr:undecaprenyl-diphosphate phosphatase [Gammaproteobacteria bacterium]